MEAEAFEIVERVVERMDFQFAAVAGAGIDLPDRQRAAELGARGAVDALRELGKAGLVGLGRGFRERAVNEAFEQRLAHQRSCPEYEQLNDLLQSGKSATMLPSTAVSSSGHWNQEASRKWQRSTRPLPSSRSQTSTSPRKASARREAFADFAIGFDRGLNFAFRQARQNLLDQRQTLLDLADADPHPRIDVAG